MNVIGLRVELKVILKFLKEDFPPQSMGSLFPGLLAKMHSFSWRCHWLSIPCISLILSALRSQLGNKSKENKKCTGNLLVIPQGLTYFANLFAVITLSSGSYFLYFSSYCFNQLEKHDTVDLPHLDSVENYNFYLFYFIFENILFIISPSYI